jgi:hypothetical protein
LQTSEAKEAASDIMHKNPRTGQSVPVPRPVVANLSAMRTVDRLEAVLPLCVRVYYGALTLKLYPDGDSPGLHPQAQFVC